MISIDKALRLLSRSIAAAALGLSVASHAEEPRRLDEVDNIGFMRSPSTELRSKFPMCEEFLDVQWLNRDYMVGYATYDALVRKKRADVAVRERVHAVVAIPFGVPRRYDYDVYQFVRQGKLQELFDLIRNEQDLLAGLAFSIGKEEKRIDLHPGGALSYGESHPLLSDHQKTVCIAFPKGDRAWIIEGKTVEKTFSSDQIQRYIENFKNEGIKTSPEFFRQMWVLHVNGDEVLDFFKPRVLIYSERSRMRKTLEEFSYPNFIYTFSGRKEMCKVEENKMNFDLVTDGKSYFAAGCNWSELSTYK